MSCRPKTESLHLYAGDLNFGPHAWEVGALPSEHLLRPTARHFKKNCVCMCVHVRAHAGVLPDVCLCEDTRSPGSAVIDSCDCYMGAGN